MSEDKFIFSAGIKKNLMIILGVGVILTIIGAMLVSGGGHGHGAEMEQAGEHFSWIQRLWTNLWLNNVFFAGIGLIGVFFVAINYAAQAGWSAYIKRIPEAFGAWLPISGILMVILFFVINYTGHFHMFHWLNPELYDKSSEHYDKILAGKKNIPQCAIFPHTHDRILSFMVCDVLVAEKNFTPGGYLRRRCLLAENA